VELSLNVEPANRPGVFTLSGSTNVPDQSQIIVQGIRPLVSTAQSTDAENIPNYAILDRQTVSVSQGRWQATLKLWQNTPDGQYQEAWQANERPLGSLQPDPEIIFLAAIDPGNQSKALKQQLERQGKTLEGAVRFTTDEQWYLQAKKTLAVTPPIVKQLSSTLKATDSDETLPLRSDSSATTTTLTQATLPVIKEKQSTAPLSVSQRFR
jgi:hypothetical protein